MIFRRAVKADVPALVQLLTEDALGATREGAPLSRYEAAFDEIAAQPMHQLIVAEEAGVVIACAQLTLLAGLSRQGAKRALVEAVRVTAARRSQGIGRALMEECEARARAAGAVMVQLTSDKSRKDAHRFYEGLGYDPSHIGFKKPLA
jgi:GNAT superfamily N-acetyltransferase